LKGENRLPDYNKSFIEMQFPVSKVSKESYKERKANLGQTLTGLGKWWGRKPLVLVRAALLGVLMPVSDDPVKDRDIFLKILTMDDEGLYIRKSKNISTNDVYVLLNPKERVKYFREDSTEEKAKYIKGLSKEDKEYLQKIVFYRLSYDEKLIYCDRPEHIKNLSAKAWDEVNAHLQTSASSFQELIKELGEKRYGHTPRVGDCFSGGGSIPFEAARMGADVYASDLNPIASLLTWASLNIAGACNEEVKQLKEFQEKIYNEVDSKIIEWGIEHNEQGDRADSYLYCNETICPECGYKVPLAPSWIIGKGTKTVALLKDNKSDGFNIDIVQGASREQFKEAEDKITIRNGKVYCPHCNMETPISAIRGDRKDSEGRTVYSLRKWGKHEFIPGPDDVFQERLYAIRYVEEYIDDEGDIKTERYYTSPTENDLEREEKVINLLSKVFDEWQEKGYIPSMRIEEGDETSRLQRERGWQYWHQLFNPRQLLIHGLFSKLIYKNAKNRTEFVIGLLGLNKTVDWDSKLCIWNVGAGTEKTQNTYTNQALNTLYNYGTRGLLMYKSNWFMNLNNYPNHCKKTINVIDARDLNSIQDVLITDPPYADAVNYHELSEYFLAWDKVLLQKAFPEWYTDSKRILTVRGVGQSFNESMIEIYGNLANHMHDNGTQVVMFTHQDVKVWSELAMILWSAGLRVVSAWNIATETEASGLKQGNYVKGTVLLTLKKQTSDEKVYRDELYDDIKEEVESMIDSMRDIDEKDDPDFTDADYLLAAHAASLKVLTAYREIQGIDVSFWLSQPRNSKEENPIEKLIIKAVKIAYDYLIPDGFDKMVWRDLSSEERFFVRGLELEMNNVYKISAYQELARGFGVKDYNDMFASFKANTARLMTPSEFKMRFLGNEGFGSSTLRHLLVAINEAGKAESTVEGRAYLRSAFQKDNEYWFKKTMMIEILDFFSRIEHIEHMEHWHKHAHYSKLLREALKNDGV
jgi:putative DNA methylase